MFEIRTRKELLLAIILFLWIGCSNIICVLLYGDTGGKYSNLFWGIIFIIFLIFQNKGKLGEYLKKPLKKNDT
jgi:hypothetical protein